MKLFGIGQIPEDPKIWHHASSSASNSAYHPGWQSEDILVAVCCGRCKVSIAHLYLLYFEWFEEPVFIILCRQ